MEERDREAEGQSQDVTPSLPTAAELRLILLTEDLQDDITSYRRREAAWISLATHAVIIALLLLVPRWTGNRAVIVPLRQKQDITFMPLPEDKQKVKPPKTDIASDKNRIAQSRNPSIDKDTLRKLMDARKAGQPKPAAPAPPAQQAMQQNPATAQVAPPAPQVQQPPPQNTAQLQTPVPDAPKKSPFAIASPGSSVNQAIQSVAKAHPGGGVDYGGGEHGSGIRPRVDTRGGMEILSDTMGVDFGPYMKRLHYTVQSHWDPLIPESAMPPVMKKGVVVIEFAITKEGKVMGMKLISSSGDVSLDRAAWGAVTDAIPLPNLPTQFAGDFLLIRARFYYNPDKADME